MSVLTDTQQQLYTVVYNALPRWMFKADLKQELFGAYAVLFDSSRQQIDYWVDMGYISAATGIWLNQHAIDRGTSRHAGEDDDTLRLRLVSYTDTQTVPALTAAINTLLVSNGISTPVSIFTLRMNRAFFQTSTVTGRKVAYFDRGFRMGAEQKPGVFIVILPYGTTADIISQVREILRQLQAAGFLALIEVRANP